MGPNNENRVMGETNDISYISPEGRETSEGVLVWQNSESGQKDFTLQIKPHSGWEIAKRFIIQLFDIRGFPASGGNGETNPATAQIELVVNFV